ncbi:MAG: peroxiredoxin [Balneolaceae bacterium]|nr:MAG: peroxiredoxin [Balneolaceae bacterium]
MTLKTGDTAPDFTLTDQEGRSASLDSLLGKGPLVLFFYPKDDSPGCTRQACSFRDNYAGLLENGVTVAGVSRDPESDHASFIGKYNLPYPLLSDATGEIHKKYGVLGLFGMLTRRVTFLIDQKKQILLRHEDNFRMDSHVAAVLRVLKS